MITFGKHSYNASSDINCYDKVNLIIGNFCSIAGRLRIQSGLHPNVLNPEIVSQYPFHEQWGVDYPPSVDDGQVIIGNDVWIAGDVIILSGVTVGDGAIIACNSVVTKDVPPYAFVAGNPAEIKKYRFSQEIIDKLLEIKWWDWSDEEVRNNIKYFRDINKFVDKFGERNG